MKNKKMYVIFHNLEEVHLYKDVGALPRALKTEMNFDVTILSTLREFSNHEFEKDVSLKFFTKSKKQFFNKLMLFLHVVITAKKLDLLMVFHGGLYNYIVIYISKLLNPKLITFVKLDLGELGAYSLLNRNNNENYIKKGIRKFLANKVNFYTVETQKVYDMIKNLPIFKNKVYYLPNGFFLTEEEYHKSYSKEKIFVTVGRIGSPQKNNELLLEAIKYITDFNGYKFYFIGPIEESFKKKIKKFYIDNPHLKNVVIFTGNIIDRELLYDYYKKAEVLCFTSLYEGFSLVMVEALSFGCYLISTDLAAAYDLTNSGKYGTIIEINKAIINQLFPKFIAQSKEKDIQKFVNKNHEAIINSEWFTKSSKELSTKLQEIINKDIDTSTNSSITRKNVYTKFNWKYIAKQLKDIINKYER